jgi:hypothetical protein
MVVYFVLQPRVTGPAVGVDGAARRDGFLDETMQAISQGIKLWVDQTGLCLTEPTSESPDADCVIQP